jgi:ABC-type transport system involved in cytochrome bd biosynthesis fused ATPase/permease subunit
MLFRLKKIYKESQSAYASVVCAAVLCIFLCGLAFPLFQGLFFVMFIILIILLYDSQKISNAARSARTDLEHHLMDVASDYMLKSRFENLKDNSSIIFTWKEASEMAKTELQNADQSSAFHEFLDEVENNSYERIFVLVLGLIIISIPFFIGRYLSVL